MDAPDGQKNPAVTEDSAPISKSKGKKSPKASSEMNGVTEKDADSADAEEVPTASQSNGTVAKGPIMPTMADMTKYMQQLQFGGAPQFQFWNTQPVPSIDEKIAEGVNEAIEPNKSMGEIRAEPYNLPSGFHWDTLDLNKTDTLQELYVLLNENYVEDDDNMFRFDYSREFLTWALQPPGWRKIWHVGVKVTKTQKLMGFISAVPANIRIYDTPHNMVEINFLCVHKKLRTKRLAPVLIKEITRRVNLQGIFQAVYTAGVMLPRPVSSCRYWHRNLNPKKLIEVKFSHLGKNMTMQRTLRLYKLPDKPITQGFRKVTKKDLPDCRKLLEGYLKRFNLSPMFTLEEFTHWFFPKENIVDSYLVERGGVITDFVSYYTLPSTVMHHPSHSVVKAAYAFYNVSSGTPWNVLMKDALISAKNMKFDVFNALDLMENKTFLEELKFGQGDGNLQYYMYNWRCSAMQPEKVGLVLQ
uniref:Glycylpeptide N-tetradecanoyltransferase n=2 Tax=Hirondellea gigas TaxID=1518452 RepID=A0A2P2I4Z4_9CRUS